MAFSKIKYLIKKRLFNHHFSMLESSVIEINNVEELKKIFGWKNAPILNDSILNEFDYLEDVNERRIRDAESIAVVMANSNPNIALEIGTSTGHTTALMATNAPQATIHTMNIPPEEILSGEGGKYTTIALEREKVGIYFREKNIKNIVQILSNSAKWEPNIGNIDVAFIDGSHDTDFVYNDTLKILSSMKSGSFILWHDFNLELTKKHSWIHTVCAGVEKLYADGKLNGRIYHIRDSWVGIYRVN